MTEQDLTDTWLRLKALEQAITAFSEITETIPSDDRYASFMVVMAERIEGEFCALQSEMFRTFGKKPVNTAA